MPDPTPAPHRLATDERGAVMLEYGLVATLVAMAVVGSVIVLRVNVLGLFAAAAGVLP